jgi:hypothetical protein
MSNLSRQSADEQINNRISSVSISQQNERTTTCDEKHDLSPKYSSSIKLVLLFRCFSILKLF